RRLWRRWRGAKERRGAPSYGSLTLVLDEPARDRVDSGGLVRVDSETSIDST
ncbi:hypothetical protein K1T71_012408, partial [Dendrolimus kikuchii]